VLSSFVGCVGWVIAATFSIKILPTRRSEGFYQFAVAELWCVGGEAPASLGSHREMLSGTAIGINVDFLYKHGL
jgi:hypothetical protein